MIQISAWEWVSFVVRLNTKGAVHNQTSVGKFVSYKFRTVNSKMALHVSTL